MFTVEFFMVADTLLIVNFGPKAHSPDVNLCIVSVFDPKITEGLIMKLGPSVWPSTYQSLI